MKRQIKRVTAILLALYFLVSLTTAVVSAAKVIVYEDFNFEGENLDTTFDTRYVGDKFNDKISSIKIESGTWRFYEDSNYEGRYWDLEPGEYSGVEDVGIPNDLMSSFKQVNPAVIPSITVYEDFNFEGENLDTTFDTRYVGDQFNDKISSIKIESGTWRFYEDSNYEGRYWDLEPGEYSGVEDVGIPNDLMSSFKQVSPSITVYEDINFEGEGHDITFNTPYIGDQFNDKISSIKVESGTWRFYEDANYEGRYWDLEPGEYSWVEDVGIPNDLISSFKQVNPSITVYEDINFEGEGHDITFNTLYIGDQFNDKISSIKVESGTWRFYEDANYEGRYWDLGPGEYSWVEDVGIPNDLISSFKQVNPAVIPSITVYEDINFEGESLEADYDTPYIGDQFNDKISSIKVESGTWRFYEHANYEGSYWDLGPGEYSWVEDVGIPNDLISSFKQI